MKNTPKNTLLFRLACLALFALDCYTVTVEPAPWSVVLLWLCSSVALVVAIAPVRSKFSL